jgi:A/G-specific adenine glycosylase
VLRAWGRLGYPRRALRLREAGAGIVGSFDGRVPDQEENLRSLPGIGSYTAAAVAAFAYGQRTVVLDTNVRRVLARAVGGDALAAPSPTAGERARAESLLPAVAPDSVRWNVAVMELGALVCRARSPRCDGCPLAGWCAWQAAGRPADSYAPRRRSQAWEGTDRQVRGQIMAALRSADDGAIPRADALAIAPGRLDQALCALESLMADGLAVESDGTVHLPR